MSDLARNPFVIILFIVFVGFLINFLFIVLQWLDDKINKDDDD